MRGLGALILAALLPLPLAAQQAAAPLRLVRCAAGSEAICLSATFRLDPAASRLAGRLDSIAEQKGWAGDLAGTRLIGPGVVQGPEIAPPLRLLILIDRSSEMGSEALAFTRTALRSFLTDLDPASVRVAIAGFDSRMVSVGIASRRFLTPAEAIDSLQQIASPDPRSHRALFSALVSGVTRTAAAIKAEPGTMGVVLVIANGPNTVDRVHDEAGLLFGAAGLQSAAEAIRESGITTWGVALASDSATMELRALTRTSGEVASSARDPNQLSARLTALGRELHGGRTLTFGLDARSSAGLARAQWAGTAALWIGGHPVLAVPLSWRPPLFALPAFGGIALEPALPSRIRDMLATDSNGVSPQLLVGVVVLLIIAGLWIFVPRLVWIRDAEPGATAATSRRVSTTEHHAALGRGIVAGEEVHEAEPRRPDEATKQTARRSAERR
jgi:hypothetical protein